MNTDRQPLRRALLAGLFLSCPGLGWAFTCSLMGSGTTQGFSGSEVNVSMSITLFCARAWQSDPATMPYRLHAGVGGNGTSASPYRAVRLGTTSHRLPYTLNRAASTGSTASCASTTNWVTGSAASTQPISGTLNFGSRTSVSVTWNYCLRVGALASQQPWPAAGSYLDTFVITASDFTGGPVTLAVPVTVNVAARCALSQPGPLTFNYPSFSRDDVTAANQADLRCSNGLPWSASLDQGSGRLLGLDYTLSVFGPALSASGSGNGLAQRLEVIGLIRRGQAGNCTTAACSARRTHTLTITY